MKKIDIFPHIFPKAYFDKMVDVIPNKSAVRRWLEIPVLYGLPMGHGATLATLPLGVEATVDADGLSLTIDEPALLVA